jgi:hypothetical protein
MKTIFLKKATEQVPQNGTMMEMEMSTLELIKTVLASSPQGGLTYTMIKERMKVDKVLDQLEAAQKNGGKDIDKVQLEDATYNILAQAVKDMRWVYRTRFVSEFVASFE